MISLDSFLVMRKLYVGNITIETRRIKASYITESLSGDKKEFELIYSYDYPVFENPDRADLNLASMITAQAAFNYGIFFEEIEFEGLYDSVDRDFIERMIENTSREIICNKLLVKNEFLKPPFNSLKIDKRKKYTQAKISFRVTAESYSTESTNFTSPDRKKYAILSSGGKDSLLTYGIIKEIGIPYPIFINESGRHWFTAVNSYRDLQKSETNARKPWCNSDRLFNWMLRQLPFIKSNYQNVRSDIYPLRLWTVAVFIFGALPLVKKYSIGNILIGNEYDTTIVSQKDSIRHYNGLYDQSKYFDNELSKYYYKKRWMINQFSILRTLSEMLIMKILIKRYPDLQRSQVSCHAAHEKDGRMYPCGKCEKCRRIIGMILALKEKPYECGYTEEQVIWGLKALEKQNVKQIESDSAHLYYLLLENNLISRNKFTQSAARENCEIVKLRFDTEKSNLEDIPLYVRHKLFSILTQYSEGAVVKQNNIWKAIIPNKDYLESIKYKFDKAL